MLNSLRGALTGKDQIVLEHVFCAADFNTPQFALFAIAYNKRDIYSPAVSAGRDQETKRRP